MTDTTVLFGAEFSFHYAVSSTEGQSPFVSTLCGLENAVGWVYPNLPWHGKICSTCVLLYMLDPESARLFGTKQDLR